MSFRIESDCVKEGPAPFRGGQISRYVPAWRQLSSDPWLIKAVQGVEIPLEVVPVQIREPSQFRLGEHEKKIIQGEVEKLLAKEIVERVEDEPGQVISNVFLRPKKDGGHRMILDLTWVNTHVEYDHFKMCSLQTALDMMRRDCWMGSIDLRDAYYSVLVKPEQRKLLRFRWDDKLYQFRVLPNGLYTSPIATFDLNYLWQRSRSLNPRSNGQRMMKSAS